MARRRRRKSYSSLDPTLSRGIIAVVLVIFAAVITLSFFDKAGTVGEILNEGLLSMVFGSMRYAVPIIMLVFAWFLMKDIDYDLKPSHEIGAILFFIAMSGLFHIGFEPREMWIQALEGYGGGVFGMLAWVLKTYLGAIAGIVILVGIALVSLILLFNDSRITIALLRKMLFSGIGWVAGKTGNGVKKMAGIRGEEEEDYDEEEEYEDEEDEEEDYDEEEEDEEDERRFSKKRVGEDDEDYEDEPPRPVPQPAVRQKVSNEDPDWLQNAVIRPLPSSKLLRTTKSKPTSGDIKANTKTIRDTLREFRIDVTMGEVRVGPTVTQFSLKPAKGVKLSRITSLNNDLALALAAHPIRIEAPIPGKSLVGIEVPNTKTALVTFKELMYSKDYRNRKHNMMVAVGKDVAGKVWIADLPKMPHLLVAGATGSGKTVCINTIIMSLLFQNTAADLRMIMVDPKRVELTMYNGIPHLLTPVITDTKKTVNALKWTIGEMERRFEVFSQAGSRDISSYNKRHPDRKIPHIVFIIDELADLMATAGNDVEAGIIRLAQMARAVGIHLVLATQRPSVDVITGLMKANIPARIAFSVASIIDSRTILDCPGAEKLIGRGDMLFQTADLSKPVRLQGAFITEEELKNVVKFLKGGSKKPIYEDAITEKPKGGTVNMFGGPSDDQDPLFEEAKEAIVEAGKASASFLQRRLKVGYARAARILDELEEAGIVGPADGAKPREILITERELDTSMQAGQEFNAYDEEETENTEDIEEEFDEEEDNNDYEEYDEDEEEDEEIEDEDEDVKENEYEDDSGEEEPDEDETYDDEEEEPDEEDNEEYGEDEEDYEEEEEEEEEENYDEDEDAELNKNI